ncbi:YoaK family protein [Nocardioides sp. LHD-245]|uniref:YoaK family protein n=1 Tax=Nocardioides sp. LHD-245 TaxID=3051387 RepID=UPI0027E0C27F|nr:YoaK family protein [Nocardioides sp. LHD-245]
MSTVPERPQLWAMIALTFTTGIVDAIGFLGLDRVFTGNMTGNVVILGMALTGADGLPVAGPLLALAGFMVGAAVGGRALRGAAPGWTRRTTGLLAAVGLLLLALGVAAGSVGTEREPIALAVTTTLGAAMGLQAATARFLAVKDVTTVVVTSTLTGLAADSRLGLGTRSGSWRRLAAVVAIGLGALTGALLLRAGLGWSLVVVAVIVLVTTFAAAATGSRAATGSVPASSRLPGGMP